MVKYQDTIFSAHEAECEKICHNCMGAGISAYGSRPNASIELVFNDSRCDVIWR